MLQSVLAFLPKFLAFFEYKFQCFLKGHWVLIYPLLWIISILPFRILYVVSDILYLLVYYIIGYRKKTVKYNLTLVFPNKSEKEITALSKKFYHHLCDMILESVKSLTVSEAEMMKRFKATKATENASFILTKVDGGVALVKVDKDSGKTLDEIVIKDKNPMYEVDDIEGLLYFKSKGNTINAYKLNK